MRATAMVVVLISAAACSGGGAGAKATRSARAAITPTPTLPPIVKTLAAGLPTAYAEATTHAATFPGGPPIAGMSWVSADEGWLVRGTAQVLHTTDGGRRWKLQHQQDGLMPAAIQFVDPQHGWVAGGAGAHCPTYNQTPPDCRGALLRTSDGGKTWIASSPADSTLDEIRFTSASTGWATAFTICSTCSESPLLVLHTSDGGRTWAQRTLAQLPRDPNHTLDHALAAIASERALVGTDEDTYRTDDGGTTWQIVSPSPCTQTQAVVRGGSFARAYMLDSATGWATCAGDAGEGFRASSLYETMDGGRSWTLISDIETPAAHSLPNVGFFPGGVGEMLFFDKLNGWYADGRLGESFVYRTSNGGHDWARVSVPITDYNSMVQFVDPQHGWVANDRQIARTTDGGAHWTEIALPP